MPFAPFAPVCCQSARDMKIIKKINQYSYILFKIWRQISSLRFLWKSSHIQCVQWHLRLFFCLLISFTSLLVFQYSGKLASGSSPVVSKPIHQFRCTYLVGVRIYHSFVSSPFFFFLPSIPRYIRRLTLPTNSIPTICLSVFPVYSLP